jgi:hypothetical protein
VSDKGSKSRGVVGEDGGGAGEEEGRRGGLAASRGATVGYREKWGRSDERSMNSWIWNKTFRMRKGVKMIHVTYGQRQRKLKWLLKKGGTGNQRGAMRQDALERSDLTITARFSSCRLNFSTRRAFYGEPFGI